jgi:hypothetical protein
LVLGLFFFFAPDASTGFALHGRVVAAGAAFWRAWRGRIGKALLSNKLMAITNFGSRRLRDRIE